MEVGGRGQRNRRKGGRGKEAWGKNEGGKEAGGKERGGKEAGDEGQRHCRCGRKETWYWWREKMRGRCHGARRKGRRREGEDVIEETPAWQCDLAHPGPGTGD